MHQVVLWASGCRQTRAGRRAENSARLATSLPAPRAGGCCGDGGGGDLKGFSPVQPPALRMSRARPLPGNSPTPVVSPPLALRVGLTRHGPHSIPQDPILRQDTSGARPGPAPPCGPAPHLYLKAGESWSILSCVFRTATTQTPTLPPIQSRRAGCTLALPRWASFRRAAWVPQSTSFHLLQFPSTRKAFPTGRATCTLGAQPKTFPEERTRLLQPLLERLPESFHRADPNHQ